MRILVTGANGQLGRTIVDVFAPGHDVTATTVEELDIRDRAAVARACAAVAPDVIVNCAAYTDVDGSEEHPVDALEVNAFGVRTLAAGAAAAGACLVHYSTDFVFDGRADRPYREEDAPNPRSTYACSKLLGEWFAAEAPRHYVLRVESLFGARPLPGESRRGSVDRIVDGILAGEPVRVFADRTISPSRAGDVAAATRALVERDAAHGLYHCVSGGTCTWFELAREAARLLGVEPRLVPVTMAEARLRAERPTYCALSNGKLAAAGIPMPRWQDALAAHLAARHGPPGCTPSAG